MTVNCSDEIPYSEDFFKVISVAELVCIVISGVLTLMTLGLFMENIVLLRKRHETFTPILFKAAVILSIYAAVSIFSFFALCFPRAHLVCNFCTSIYISIGMYIFMKLLLEHFGGKQELLRHTRNDKIRLNFPPFCCCCVPPFRVTRKVLNTAHFFVGQLAILQIVLSFLSLVLWLDEKLIIGKISADTASIYFTIVRVTSTLLGVGGLRLMVNICASIDESLKISTKSRIVIIVLILHNVQGFVFNILASNNIPECSSKLSTSVKGRAWNNMIIILEMFLLGVVSSWLYHHPSRRNFSPSEIKGYSRESPPDAETSFPADSSSPDQKDNPS